MTTHSREYQRLVKGLFRYAYPVDGQPEEYRAALRRTAGLFTLPKGVAARADAIDGIPVEWIEPEGARRDALLVYVHGGGYYMGSVDTYRHYVMRFAQITGLRTLHFDYRLAPEHPFPAALEDATAVVRYACDKFGADHVVVAGDSAGGGLTLSTLLALRDQNFFLPKAAAVIAPWTDLTCTAPSIMANRDKDPVLGRGETRRGAAWYAGAQSLTHPLVSPLYADLRGMPPVLMHVGTEDILFDDSTHFAERARAAGVDVRLDVWEAMIHVWHYYAEWIPEGRDAIQSIGEFFATNLD